MPRRNAEYMESQREEIARAALEVMLEQGLSATSIRDVATKAGISLGALYVHFKTRDDLVMAACAVEPWRALSGVSSWSQYVDSLCGGVIRISNDDRTRRLTRLSLEFVAEHALANANLPEGSRLFETSYDTFRDVLNALRQSGEITLPLGLEDTAMTHCQLVSGASYVLVADKRADAAVVVRSLRSALERTAGVASASPE